MFEERRNRYEDDVVDVRKEKSLSTDEVEEHDERGPLVSLIVGNIGAELEVELLLARYDSLLQSSAFGGRGGGTSSFGSGEGARMSITRSCSSVSVSAGGNTRSTGTPSPRSLQTRAIFSRRNAIGEGIVKLGSYRESHSESRVYVEDRLSLSFCGRAWGGVLISAEKECERSRVANGGSEAGRRRDTLTEAESG